MIFLLQSKTTKATKVSPISGFLRGALAIVLLVMGVFALTMMATVVLILGGIVVLAAFIWWILVGKKRMTKLRQSDFATSNVQESEPFPGARAGHTIEGELVKEP